MGIEHHIMVALWHDFISFVSRLWDVSPSCWRVNIPNLNQGTSRDIIHRIQLAAKSQLLLRETEDMNWWLDVGFIHWLAVFFGVNSVNSQVLGLKDSSG